MISSILASLSAFICTIGRELNERGMLASVLYAVFAVALPYLASKLGVKKADSESEKNEGKRAEITVFALVCCVFGITVTLQAGIVGCVLGLAVVGMLSFYHYSCVASGKKRLIA